MSSATPATVPRSPGTALERSGPDKTRGGSRARNWPSRLRAFKSALVRFGSTLTFLAAVALAPLPFGLTAPAPMALCCLMLALSLFSAEYRELRPAHLLVLSPVLVASAVYFAMALIQHNNLFLPPAPVWEAAERLVGSPLPRRSSWTVAGSWTALGPALLVALTCTRSIIFSVSRDRARVLLAVVAGSGAIYAGYGIVAHFVTPELLLWRPKTAYLDAVTGTFVNRNTAATYWGSCSIVSTVMLLEVIRSKREGQSPTRKLWLRVLPALAATLLCLLATAMTGSRAGLILTMIAFAGVVFGHAQLVGQRGVSWRVMVPTAIVVVVAVQTLGGTVADRIHLNGLTDEGRLAAWRETLAMINDNAVFGVGVGNFAAVFPRYRGAAGGSAGVWDRAHSTPLEMAAEAGLPVTITVGLCCLFMLHILLKGCLLRRRDRWIPVAGLAVGLLGFLHSCVDFSVQIAGYGVVFAAIVGCGLAQTVPTRIARDEKIGSGIKRGWPGDG